MNLPVAPVRLLYLPLHARLSGHTDHPNQQVKQHHIRMHGVQCPSPHLKYQNCALLPQVFPHRAHIPHIPRAVNIERIYTWIPRYLISQRRGKQLRLNLQILASDGSDLRPVQSKAEMTSTFFASGKSKVLHLLGRR